MADPAEAQPNLRSWATLLSVLGLTRITLVPHHALGSSKRTWLGLAPAPQHPSATAGHLRAARDTLARQGITVFDPGEEDW